MHHAPARIFLSDSIDLCVERGVELRIWCGNAPLAGACGHAVVMPAATLRDLCDQRGWPRTLITIGERLRCSRCGKNWPHIEVVGQVPG